MFANMGTPVLEPLLAAHRPIFISETHEESAEARQMVPRLSRFVGRPVLLHSVL